MPGLIELEPTDGDMAFSIWKQYKERGIVTRGYTFELPSSKGLNAQPLQMSPHTHFPHISASLLAVCADHTPPGEPSSYGPM